MKKKIKKLIIILSVLCSTAAFAEQNIAYVDMSYVLNNSKAGKEAQDFLKKKISKDQKNFSKTEELLKKEEKNLLTKKSILSKEEYKANTDSLRKKVVEYQSERRKALDSIGILRSNARKRLLENLSPILDKYKNDNQITLVIDKKIVISGSAETDITEIIIEELNKKLPSLSLK